MGGVRWWVSEAVAGDGQGCWVGEWLRWRRYVTGGVGWAVGSWWVSVAAAGNGWGDGRMVR